MVLRYKYAIKSFKKFSFWYNFAMKFKHKERIFSDNMTKCNKQNQEEMNEENAIYDLAGRRLTRLGKGVNIVGGKKIIVK